MFLSLNLNIKDNIIIIDETHNIRKVCEAEKSFEIYESDFNDILIELGDILKKKKIKLFKRRK